MKNSLFLLVAFTFLDGVISHPISIPEPIPYSHLDKTIDQILLKIENSIKSQNFAEFSKHFHREFDANAWFNRYYSQQSENELASWVIRRFGETLPRGNGQFEIKVTESHFNGNQFFLRSLLVVTKPDVDRRGKPNNHAIVAITRYGAY